MDIKINQDRCKGCGLCVEFFCPNNVFGEKEKIGKRGFKEVIVVSPDKCNGCGLCEYCPEGAIKVTGRRDLPLDYFWRAMKKRKKEAAKNNLPRGGWKKEKTCHPGIHNISGNTAFVWGALDAGCDAGISARNGKDDRAKGACGKRSHYPEARSRPARRHERA